MECRMGKTFVGYARRTLAASGSLYLGCVDEVVPPPRASDQELAEIIVTATKRQERIQDIPVSVTAFTGKQLSEMGADNFVDYAREVPSLPSPSAATAK